MKNHGNIQPTQKFNTPIQHECIDGGTCFVYDGQAWRNKNRPQAPQLSRYKKPVQDEVRNSNVRNTSRS